MGKVKAALGGVAAYEIAKHKSSRQDRKEMKLFCKIKS